MHKIIIRVLLSRNAQPPGKKGSGVHVQFASSLSSVWFEFMLYHFWDLQTWMSSQACNIIHNMGTIMLLLLCPTVWMLRVYLYRSLFPNTKGFYYLKKKKKIEYAYSLLVLCFLRSDFANLVSHIFPKAKQFLTTLLCNYLTFLYSIFPLNLQCFIENCFFCWISWILNIDTTCFSKVH